MFQRNAVKKIKIHISCSNNFFHENRAVYDVMWGNTVYPVRSQMPI